MQNDDAVKFKRDSDAPARSENKRVTHPAIYRDSKTRIPALLLIPSATIMSYVTLQANLTV